MLKVGPASLSRMVAMPESLSGGVPLLVSVPVRVKVSFGSSMRSATVSVLTSTVLLPLLMPKAVPSVIVVQVLPPSRLYWKVVAL